MTSDQFILSICQAFINNLQEIFSNAWKKKSYLRFFPNFKWRSGLSWSQANYLYLIACRRLRWAKVVTFNGINRDMTRYPVYISPNTHFLCKNGAKRGDFLCNKCVTFEISRCIDPKMLEIWGRVKISQPITSLVSRPVRKNVWKNNQIEKNDVSFLHLRWVEYLPFFA